MKAAPLALLLLAAAGFGPAAAQTPPPVRIAPPASGATQLPPSVPPPPGPIVYGPSGLTPDVCRRLAERQRAVPPAGYQPGVDVYGRPVAPADLPGAAAAVPPITTEIQLGHVGTGRAATGGFIRGYVTVEPGGNVLLNGQPLPREQEYGLFDLCRDQRLIP